MVEAPVWGRAVITVFGQPAPRTGRQFALPATAGGTVQATLKSGFADAYPTIEINGIAHRTGPTPPAALRVLAMVPILLVAVGGLIGGLIGVVGVLANLSIARTQMSAAGKAFAMIGVIVARRWCSSRSPLP